MKKKYVITICLLLVLGISLTGILMLINGEKSYRSVLVQELNGKTEVLREAEELSAYKGMKLQGGDVVDVQEQSDLFLKLDENKYIYAKESTSFCLKEIGKENAGRVRIVLQEGQTLVDIQEKLQVDESFEIETRNAVLAVRGTKFEVKVYTNGNGEYVTEVVGFEGEVYLETGTGETTGVLPGKTVYVIGEETPVMIVQNSETKPEERQSSETTPTPTPTPEPWEELVVVEVYSGSGSFIENAYVILEDSHGNFYEAVLEVDALGNQSYQATILTGSYVINVSAHGYSSITKEEIVGAENQWLFTLAEKEMDLNYGEFNGHSYRFIEAEAMTWEQAEQICNDLDGYPAVISSQMENDFLNRIMQENGYRNAYFGYSDEVEEGAWIWLSGEMNAYENWAAGEPNNSGDEDYAMFYYQFPNGEWNDGNFGQGTVNDTKVIICEWDSNDIMSNMTPAEPFR